MSRLGRLERVDLRQVWQREAGDFTPWLAQEENLALISEIIGLELELESTEKSVGPFRADILCKDTVTNNWVLIENQLEQTDHTHLGQLLTYATGLDAVTIVWIAERFREEHRATLDWLNESTSKEINFFGLEVELWQIGDSEIAPKFNIASKPNDWTKTISSIRQSAETQLSPTKQLHLEYWESFNDYLETNHSLIRRRTALPQNWCNFAIGHSGFYLSTSINTQKNRIGVSLIIDSKNTKYHFNQLFQQQNTVEAEIGQALKWRELPDKKTSYIELYHNADPRNVDDWQNQHAWLKHYLEAFHRTFAPRIKNLKND